MKNVKWNKREKQIKSIHQNDEKEGEATRATTAQQTKKIKIQQKKKHTLIKLPYSA